MFSSYEEMLGFIQTEKVEELDLRATDLNGRWYHLTIPTNRLDPRLFEYGEAFDSSNMPGFRSVESGDMVLLPDPSTAFIDPFFERRTLAVICNLVDSSKRSPYIRDPRGIARRVESYLTVTGIAEKALFAPEFEFYLLDDVTYQNDVCSGCYRVFSKEGRLSRPDSSEYHGFTLAHKGGYHATPPADRYHNVRSEIVRLLEEAGVPCRYHHHEVGSMGQQEIEVLLHTPVRSADISMMVKYFVRNVAARHGLVATFIPKLFYTEAGTGMHFHQTLMSADNNLFYDKSGYGNLSPLAFRYIAGLLLHAPALLAFTNPTTNSYRRLVPGYEAPIKAFFSLANRSATIRIPSYANQPDSVRIEFRPPDATCNPYLAISAMLLSGIDGIRRDLDPSKLGFGPFDNTVYECQEGQEIPSLPTSLDEALDALMSDHSFLLEGDVFDESLINEWIRLRRAHIDSIRQRPHPYEIETLLDC